MKITMMLTGGIDGCGVTKFAIDLQRYISAAGHDVKTIYPSVSMKKFSRSKAHEHEFTPVDFEDYSALKAATDVDIVIIHSVPTKKDTETLTANYLRMLNETKSRVVMYFHDHTKHSLKTNQSVEDTIVRADILMSLSSKGVFLEKVSSVCPHKVINNFQPGIDMARLRAEYWKPVEQQIESHRWVGRTTPWKGYDLMLKFMIHLKPQFSYLEGLDRCIAFAGIRNSYGPYINECKKRDYKLLEYKPNLMHEYINSEMLQRMSGTMFGYQLSKLKPAQVDRALECTHLEISAVGALPIFRDYNVDYRLGGKLADYDSGIIWLNEDNFDEVADKLEQMKDPILRDKARNKAYDFIFSHQDSSYTFAEQLEIITK